MCLACSRSYRSRIWGGGDKIKNDIEGMCDCDLGCALYKPRRSRCVLVSTDLIGGMQNTPCAVACGTWRREPTKKFIQDTCRLSCAETSVCAGREEGRCRLKTPGKNPEEREVSNKWKGLVPRKGEKRRKGRHIT